MGDYLAGHHDQMKPQRLHPRGPNKKNLSNIFSPKNTAVPAAYSPIGT
jgi:hypothetical protein